MGLEYYYNFNDNGVVYSLDMLRYKFFVSKFYKAFPSRLHRFLIHNCKHVVVHRSLYSYSFGRYGALFECELFNTGKLIIGFDLLSVVGYSWECFIEFNPNKCLDVKTYGADSHVFDIINFIRQWEAPGCPIFSLIRFDIAIDFPLSRDRFVLVRKNGRTYHKIIGDSITEYLGQKNTDGYVKLYDKTFEYNSELKKTLKNELKMIKKYNYGRDEDNKLDIDDDDMQEYFEEYKIKEDITRLEITCSDPEKLILPEVYILGDKQSDLSELNDTQRVLVKLLNNLDTYDKSEYLNQLGRYMKDRIKPYVLGKNEIFEYNSEILAVLCDIAMYPDSYVIPEDPFTHEPCVLVPDRHKDIYHDDDYAREYYPEASQPVPENFVEIYEEDEDIWSQYSIDDYLDTY